MVRHALRVAALRHPVDLLRHDKFPLFHHLEVADDVDGRLRGYEGQLVKVLVLEELVLNLDDTLLPEEFAGEVYTDGNLVLDSLEIEYVEGLVYVFSGYMVQYGTILQCAYYQFFM